MSDNVAHEEEEVTQVFNNPLYQPGKVSPKNKETENGNRSTEKIKIKMFLYDTMSWININIFIYV